jgi:hypothetical protein
MREIYGVQMDSGTKLNKDWFKSSKVEKCGLGGCFTDTKHEDLISLLAFFKIRKIG